MVGIYSKLRVDRQVEFGFYLDDGNKGILLPRRFAPNDLKIDDEIEVFVYHDSEDKLIATTQKPIGILGDIVGLKCVDTNFTGAFLNNGLMKDLFVPKSQQNFPFKKGETYVVKIYIDQLTGRLAATQKFEQELNNDNCNLEKTNEVEFVPLRSTTIGYFVIINNTYTGVLHYDDIFEKITIGKKYKGYVKKIYFDKEKEKYLIDVAIGKRGVERIDEYTKKILSKLKLNDGFLPYNDKSNPNDIYDFFGMSKKVFKMSIGNLYKQRIIKISDSGIHLV